MNFNLPSTAASAFDLTDMETMAPLDFSSLRIPTREENQAMLDLISCDRTKEEWKTYLHQLTQFSFLWTSDWPQPLAMEHPVWGSISLAEPARLALVKGYGNLAAVLAETRPFAFCTPIILTPPEEDAIPYQLVLSPAAALAYFGRRELLERFLAPDDPDELRAPIASMLLSPAFGGGGFDFSNRFDSRSTLLTPFAAAVLGEQEECARLLLERGAAHAPDQLPMAPLLPTLSPDQNALLERLCAPTAARRC